MVTFEKNPAPPPGPSKNIAVIGAGPAGLTAAFELAKSGLQPVVLEASPYIGGISRTHRWGENRIDIGGHRFFTKSDDIKRLWAEILDEPMLKVPRLSRIFYDGKFYDYPLRILNTVGNLGILESFLMLASYAYAQFNPYSPEDSFENWVRNRFGDRLYRTFFKTYTEKVWGIPCTEIRADWAAQRIQGLNFLTAVLNAVTNSGNVKTLIKTFDYPRLGPGMMWESCARKIEKMGGQILTSARVTRLTQIAGSVTSIEFEQSGSTRSIEVAQVISSMPLTSLIKAIVPVPPPPIISASNSLRYRDFLIVAIACRKADIFPDNWIYIHSPEFRVGRIQNFRNWSPAMVSNEAGTVLGMEYFCSRGDDIWTKSDADLVSLAKTEISSLGLANPSEIEPGGCVVRELNAYPVYDAEYRTHVETLRAWLGGFSNLQTVGRNGMHRYNNQDHSMMAGQHAALRLLNRSKLDPWEVNTERSYYEEQVLPSSGRAVTRAP